MTGTVIGEVVVRAIGWAILHSMWQGVIVATLTAIALRALRGGAASVRYLVGCLGLVVLAASWGITAVGYAREATTTLSSSPQEAIEAPSSLLALPDSASLPRPRALTTSRSLPALPSWQARLERSSAIIVPLWFLGVFVLSVRLVFGWYLVERIRRTATVAVPEMWMTRVKNMADRLDIRRPIKIAESAVVHVPMVIGWLRPVILLPGTVFTGLSYAQLEAVIAHELAHIRRHDFAINILQNAAEILLFYHPAGWWLSRQIRLERENCCDDTAVALCGDRYAYAEALADLETLRSDAPALSLAATDGLLMRRVRRLVTPATSNRGVSHGWAAAVAPLTLVTLVLMGAQVIGTQAPGTGSSRSPVPSAPRTVPNTEGVLQGRVLDVRSNQPIPRATVQIFGPDRETTVVTADDGRFAAKGLAPAEYRVWARARGYAPAQYGQRDPNDRASTLNVTAGLATSIDFRLHPVGAISGRIFEPRGEGVAGIEIELLTERLVAGDARAVAVAFAQTEAFGVYRLPEVLPGDYYVRAYAPENVRPDSAQGLRLTLEKLAQQASGLPVYGSTYYPGVTGVEQAQVLRVNAGQELFDIDFTLAITKTHRVAGTVVDLPGRPLVGTLVRMHSFDPGGVNSDRTASVSADGRFEFTDVSPGNYMIMVAPADRVPSPRWFAASRTLRVDDDVLGLELKAQLGARIEGRIIPDAGVTRNLDPTRVRVGLRRRVDSGLSTFADSRVQADGTFATESPGGALSFEVLSVPPNWVVKSIRLDGVENGSDPVDFGAGARRRIDVVLTDRGGSVTGNVHDRNGRPLTNYSVVLFPEDSARWTTDSPFVRETRTDQGGQFRLDGLRADEYLAVAVEKLPLIAWKDPKVLELLRPSAARFRLREGEQTTLSLRPSPQPEKLGPFMIAR